MLRATIFLLAALSVPSSFAATCSTEEVSYTMIMTDEYGDGWNNAAYTLTHLDGTTSTGTLFTAVAYATVPPSHLMIRSVPK